MLAVHSSHTHGRLTRLPGKGNRRTAGRVETNTTGAVVYQSWEPKFSPLRPAVLHFGPSLAAYCRLKIINSQNLSLLGKPEPCPHDLNSTSSEFLSHDLTHG